MLPNQVSKADDNRHLGPYCPNIYTDAFVIQQCHAPLTARQSTRLVSKLAPSIAFLLPMKNNLQTFLLEPS